ncbi:exo-beta-N-acetylmuramidase NamZ family protein [Desulfofustis limnaeus]|jgi:uncharacterized protein YbbC (DUF1343 family)|uniref:DUF1343 domain-containing protein n=1 Tax=Desulfofustis limnaeus TaxID=2740163 RepID=A0ABM7W784_9BACT|nr:DUF1343 domain-containing protein [Desulfofustis limnaeus]MDX9896736.1 DUF1343 domain-containing protein [Desulfofustis sp.]BDD86830.1 hypothetical protein DPPLL_11950 [Desulfofustis limnaeus]
MTVLGIDVLLDADAPWPRGARLGLLCNHASLNGALVHSRLLLHKRFGADLRCLLSPQHGFFAEKQDNMIESDHAVDAATGLPVFSLYGETRRPTPQMLDYFDILLIDLPDVGTRVYTFLYTMGYCLEAAARAGKKVVVLDRPNPIGGTALEGNILQEEMTSFVGLYPLPMRHGLTFGELARYINGEYGLGVDLQVVAMRGWQREMYFADTALPWVFPSPNMPSPQTALVYPGQVIWEGTNVSEGRGTTLPFELFGAPYWRTDELLEKLRTIDLPGCLLRPLVFSPTSGKWAGENCYGFQLHVTERRHFLPYRTALALLQAARLLYPESFAYKEPPYEYEYEKLPLDLILGDRSVRTRLEAGEPVVEIERSWQPQLAAFAKLRQSYLLY